MTGRYSAAERQHFAFLHSLGLCAVSGLAEPIQVAHIRFADSYFGKPLAGVANKPAFIWTAPLSAEAHEAQHRMGERRFWKERGYDPADPLRSPLALALALAGFSSIADAEGARAFLITRISEALGRET